MCQVYEWTVNAKYEHTDYVLQERGEELFLDYRLTRQNAGEIKSCRNLVMMSNDLQDVLDVIRHLEELLCRTIGTFTSLM